MLRLLKVLLIEKEEPLDVFGCLDEEDFDLGLVHPKVDHFALWYSQTFCLHKGTATEVLHEIRILIINRTNKKNSPISHNNHKSSLCYL